MSTDLISSNKEEIFRNTFIIPSLIQSYQPTALKVVGTRMQHSGVDTSGFGNGKFTHLSIVQLGDQVVAKEISDATNVFATTKGVQKAFTFDMLALALKYRVSNLSMNTDQTNVFNKTGKDLLVQWDIDTTPTLIANETDNVENIVSATGLTIANINAAVSAGLDSFKDNLRISIEDPNIISVDIDNNTNAILRQPTTNGVTTNATPFREALGDRDFSVMNKDVSDAVKAQSSEVFDPLDGLIMMTYRNDNRLHHGMLPQVFKSGESIESLDMISYFGYNNAKFEVFEKSVVIIRLNNA